MDSDEPIPMTVGASSNDDGNGRRQQDPDGPVRTRAGSVYSLIAS